MCMYDGVCVCACVCVRFLCVRMCVRVYMGVLFECECKYLSVKNKQEKKSEIDVPILRRFLVKDLKWLRRLIIE